MIVKFLTFSPVNTLGCVKSVKFLFNNKERKGEHSYQVKTGTSLVNVVLLHLYSDPDNNFSSYVYFQDIFTFSRLEFAGKLFPSASPQNITVVSLPKTTSILSVGLIVLMRLSLKCSLFYFFVTTPSGRFYRGDELNCTFLLYFF